MTALVLKCLRTSSKKLTMTMSEFPLFWNRLLKLDMNETTVHLHPFSLWNEWMKPHTSTCTSNIYSQLSILKGLNNGRSFSSCHYIRETLHFILQCKPTNKLIYSMTGNRHFQPVYSFSFIMTCNFCCILNTVNKS